MATSTDTNKKREGSPKPPNMQLSAKETRNFDLITDFNFRPEPLSGGRWRAMPMYGDFGPVGPAKDVTSLLTQVKLHCEKHGKPLPADTHSKADERIVNPNPGSHLPGMEEPELEDLNRQADVAILKHQAKKLAATAAKDADDMMLTLLKKHGRKRYSRNGYSLVIKEGENLQIQPEKKEAKAKEKKPAIPKVVKGAGKKR